VQPCFKPSRPTEPTRYPLQVSEDALLFGDTQYGDTYGTNSVVKSSWHLKNSLIIKEKEEQLTIKLNAQMKASPEYSNLASTMTSGRKNSISTGRGNNEYLPSISNRKVFRIDPIPNNSDRFLVDQQWMKKVNPGYFDKLI
jgi:hypothetical protein